MLTGDRERLSAFERQTDLPMLVLSVAFLALLALPWFWPDASEHRSLLDTLEWTVWGVFAIELAVRVTLAPQRGRYLLHHWFDVAIVVLPFLRPLRILRAVRGVALLTRFTTTWRRLLARRGLQYVLLFALGAIVASAVAVTRAETATAGAPIEDFADGLWWAVTTVTTVGYGDTYPTTAMGRGIGVALMLVGIALFGVITANVAAYFVQEDEDERDDEILAALLRIEQRLDDWRTPVAKSARSLALPDRETDGRRERREEGACRSPNRAAHCGPGHGEVPRAAVPLAERASGCSGCRPLRWAGGGLLAAGSSSTCELPMMR